MLLERERFDMMSSNQEINQGKIMSRDFIFIWLANFFIFLGFQMTLPTLPLFVKDLGGSDQIVGLIVGVFTFSALIFRPFAGHALESRGRQVVYIFGLSLFILSVGAYAFAASIMMLITMRILQGVGWGFSTTASGTIATDLIPSKRRGEGMGYYGLSSNLALALGPALGLSLVGIISFTQLFLIAASMGLIALLLALLIRYKKVESLPDKTTTVKFDVFEKSAINPSILLFFVTLTFGGIATFLPIYALEKSVEGISLYFVVYAIFLMASRIVAGKIYDEKGHMYVFPPGATLIFIAMLLLAWLPSTTILLIAAAFYGFGFGSVQPALQAWAINGAAENRKGMANATFFSFFDLGVGVGAMGFGVIANYFGYKLIYLTSALSIAFAITYYFYLYFKANRAVKNYKI